MLVVLLVGPDILITGRLKSSAVMEPSCKRRTLKGNKGALTGSICFGGSEASRQVGGLNDINTLPVRVCVAEPTTPKKGGLGLVDEFGVVSGMLLLNKLVTPFTISPLIASPLNESTKTPHSLVDARLTIVHVPVTSETVIVFPSKEDVTVTNSEIKVSLVAPDSVLIKVSRAVT